MRGQSEMAILTLIFTAGWGSSTASLKVSKGPGLTAKLKVAEPASWGSFCWK